jgi:hypothetical protein
VRPTRPFGEGRDPRGLRRPRRLCDPPVAATRAQSPSSGAPLPSRGIETPTTCAKPTDPGICARIVHGTDARRPTPLAGPRARGWHSTPRSRRRAPRWHSRGRKTGEAPRSDQRCASSPATSSAKRTPVQRSNMTGSQPWSRIIQDLVAKARPRRTASGPRDHPRPCTPHGATPPPLASRTASGREPTPTGGGAVLGGRPDGTVSGPKEPPET